MAIIKLSKNEQRRLSVFFTCLIVAFVAWILTVLSNPALYKVKVALNYVGIPSRRAFRSLQPDTIEATVQGTGWNLLFYKMNMQDNKADISLKALDSRDFILLSNQIKIINQNRLPDQQILSFTPDTLYFDFSSRVVKRVPIKLLYNIICKRQFIISGDIVLRPTYVTVTGPAETIANIKFWKTYSLSLTDIENPVDKVVHLQAALESNMTIAPKNVSVHVPVNEFTEKTIDVPVKLVNNKNYYNVKIFPQKVKIAFTVALNKYAEIDEHSFEAVADLSAWQVNGAKQLPVKVTVFPPYCKLVGVTPQNVDFFVKE
jgi:YbbR domain-containing protein